MRHYIKSAATHHNVTVALLKVRVLSLWLETQCDERLVAKRLKLSETRVNELLVAMFHDYGCHNRQQFLANARVSAREMMIRNG